MSGLARPDLDGARLHVPTRNEVWVVYHGARHYVANASVFDALFEGVAGLQVLDSVEDILLGPELNDGTCLVRAEPDPSLYLVTGSQGPGVRRHRIDGEQSWLDFGFSLNKVREVPPLVLAGLPFGRELKSAGSRRSSIASSRDAL